MTEYKTRRSALLAILEHRCIESGVWEVEGRKVQLWRGDRVGPQGWWVEGSAADGHTRFDTFTDALEYIADKINV